MQRKYKEKGPLSAIHEKVILYHIISFSIETYFSPIKLIVDLEKVFTFFLKINEKLRKPFFNSSNKPTNSIISTTRPFEEKIDFENFGPPREFEKNDLILPKSQENSETILFTQSEISVYFGNLMPVQSGHNGCLNDEESLILEYHLRNSGFLKL